MLLKRILASLLVVTMAWQVFPRIVGWSLGELQISFDRHIAFSLTILFSSILFMMVDRKPLKDFGFCIVKFNFIRIASQVFLLQFLTIAGVVFLIVLNAPLKLPSEPLWIFFLKYVILIPICEEVFVRGLVQTNMDYLPGTIKLLSLPIRTPIFFTSILFCIMHDLPFGNVPALIYGLVMFFILSLIAGYQRQKTGSLIPSFFAHAMYNFFGGFVGKVLYLVEEAI